MRDTWPINIDVVDEVAVIAHHLDIDGVPHFAVPVVLFDSAFWNLSGSAIKDHHNAINAKSKARKVEPFLQTGGSFLHLQSGGEANKMWLLTAQFVRHPVDGQPSCFLGNSATQPRNASKMTASIKIEGDANLLNGRQRPSAVVAPSQSQDSSKPADRRFVKAKVRLELHIRERSDWIHSAVDDRRIPRSPASLSVSAGKEFKDVEIAEKSVTIHDGSVSVMTVNVE